MHSIQTKYAAIQFRSRLEARWAAFFSELNWNWEYEPYDLNGWIPDFIIIGSNNSVLIEVKPLDRFPDQMRTHESTKETYSKITRALNPPNEKTPTIVLVGISPFMAKSDGPGDVAIGRSIEPVIIWHGRDNPPEVTGEFAIDGAILGRWKNKFGIADEYGSFRDKLSGEYDGGRIYDAPSIEETKELWARACNATQWSRS